MASMAELQQQIADMDARLKDAEVYKKLYDHVRGGKSAKGAESRPAPAELAQSADFVKQKAAEYDDLLKQRDLSKGIVDNYNSNFSNKNIYGNPGSTYKGELPRMSDEYNKAQGEIMNKLAGLEDVFKGEKNSMLSSVLDDHNKLKASIAGQAQEKQATAEGLATRRGLGTKQMEDITKTSLQNQENAAQAQEDASNTAKLQQVSSLYNQLLTNLIQQYKATKDTYTLGKIQNAVNVLNTIESYKQ